MRAPETSHEKLQQMTTPEKVLIGLLCMQSGALLDQSLCHFERHDAAMFGVVSLVSGLICMLVAAFSLRWK